MGSTPPPGELSFRSIPGATPRWLRRRPLVLAGLLRLTNRVRRMKLAWLAVTVLVAIFVWAITRPFAGAALAFLAERPVISFVMAALHASTSVARIKPRLIAEGERSWLAALPFRVSVAVRVAFAFVVQLVGIAALFAGIAAVSPTPWSAARGAWLGMLGGYVAGGLFGWFPQLLLPMRSADPAHSAGSQYAIVREVREHWAIAPKLYPLSYWAVAWARVLTNPAATARTLIVVLLGIPMGTPGEEALAIAGGWMIGLYVLMNLVATVRTAFAAGRWLGPTPVRLGRFTSALISRALLIQVGVFTAGLLAVDAVQPRWLYAALGLAVAWLLVFIGLSTLACATARQPAGTAHRWAR